MRCNLGVLDRLDSSILCLLQKVRIDRLLMSNRNCPLVRSLGGTSNCLRTLLGLLLFLLGQRCNNLFLISTQRFLERDLVGYGKFFCRHVFFRLYRLG